MTEELAKIAAQLGVSEDEAADAVAQVLPTVVDKVSPEGHLAPDSELESAFEALEQLGDGTRGVRLKPAPTVPAAGERRGAFASPPCPRR